MRKGILLKQTFFITLSRDDFKDPQHRNRRIIHKDALMRLQKQGFIKKDK